MQPEVSRYLEQQREQEEADRAGVLRELGICRRVYLPEGSKLTAEAAQEYPYEEEGRRFKVEAISVTDEEWAAIRSALHRERLRTHRRRNPVSRGLWVLGFAVYAFACLLGVLAFLEARWTGHWETAIIQLLTFWFSGVLSGTLVLGVSEIIRLLDRP